MSLFDNNQNKLLLIEDTKKSFLNNLKKKYPTIKEYIIVPQYHNYNKKYDYHNIISYKNMLVSKNELYNDFPELIKFDKFIVPHPLTLNEEIKISAFINIDHYYHKEKREDDTQNIKNYMLHYNYIHSMISDIITKSIIDKYSSISFKKIE